jgi:hypothetical protein
MCIVIIHMVDSYYAPLLVVFINDKANYRTLWLVVGKY